MFRFILIINCANTFETKKLKKNVKNKTMFEDFENENL